MPRVLEVSAGVREKSNKNMAACQHDTSAEHDNTSRDKLHGVAIWSRPAQALTRPSVITVSKGVMCGALQQSLHCRGSWVRQQSASQQQLLTSGSWQ